MDLEFITFHISKIELTKKGELFACAISNKVHPLFPKPLQHQTHLEELVLIFLIAWSPFLPLRKSKEMRGLPLSVAVCIGVVMQGREAKSDK